MTFLTCEKIMRPIRDRRRFFSHVRKKYRISPPIFNLLIRLEIASRFADLDISVDEFIEQQVNENTKRKTEQHLSLLNKFLRSKNEKRSIENIPCAGLNLYLSEFIIKVRTKQNKDYEPNSLHGMIASFEGHLNKNNYGLSIMKNLQYEQTRKSVVSKQKDLKRQENLRK